MKYYIVVSSAGDTKVVVLPANWDNGSLNVCLSRLKTDALGEFRGGMKIFKEIHQDLGKPIPASGNLDRWVAQGVFPLNSVLTVRAHETGSHRNMGWEIFTDAVIRKLSEKRENLIFMLWGNYAKE